MAAVVATLSEFAIPSIGIATAASAAALASGGPEPNFAKMESATAASRRRQRVRRQRFANE